jgi:hypothetical protein
MVFHNPMSSKKSLETLSTEQASVSQYHVHTHTTDTPQLKGGEYWHERTQTKGKLLSVNSTDPGIYAIRGQGSDVQVGDQLLLPMKGTQTLSLTLKVKHIDQLIEPLNAWNAILIGHNQAQWLVRSWQVACDRCANASMLEFMCPEEADHNAQVEHAQQRLLELGWKDTAKQHICPACQAKGTPSE